MAANVQAQQGDLLELQDDQGQSIGSRRSAIA